MSEPNRSQTGGNSGRFLVLDGPDGGGKTTQAARLADWLRGLGREVVTCRDPGGTPLGERLRPILLDRHATPIAMRAEMFLYMASRAQLVEDVIRPALEAGRDVVADRFLLANLVYQGAAGGLDLDDLGRVGRVATAGLLPDLTLVLDVPLATARARMLGGRDRIEDRPTAYQEAVREGFLRAARAAESNSCTYYPAAIRVVDAARDADDVFAAVQDEVRRALAIDSRS